MTSDVTVAAEQGRPAGSGIVRSLKGGAGRQWHPVSDVEPGVEYS